METFLLRLVFNSHSIICWISKFPANMTSHYHQSHYLHYHIFTTFLALPTTLKSSSPSSFSSRAAASKLGCSQSMVDPANGEQSPVCQHHNHMSHMSPNRSFQQHRSSPSSWYQTSLSLTASDHEHKFWKYHKPKKYPGKPRTGRTISNLIHSWILKHGKYSVSSILHILPIFNQLWFHHVETRPSRGGALKTAIEWEI